MEQASIPDQQVDTELSEIKNPSTITVLSHTENVLEQDYAAYDIVVKDTYDETIKTSGWLDFFQSVYTQNIVNCLILPPGYNFATSNIIELMMSKTPIANNNPLIVYGDYVKQYEGYNENIYLPTMNNHNNSANFLQGIPLLIYRNDLLQTKMFKSNIYQVFNAILSIHIPQTLFHYKT